MRPISLGIFSKKDTVINYTIEKRKNPRKANLAPLSLYLLIIYTQSFASKFTQNIVITKHVCFYFLCELQF